MLTKPLIHGHALPVWTQIPVDSPDSNIEWVSDHAADIQAQSSRTGAMLIRGCALDDADAFRAVCAAIEPRLRDYTGGDSPRTGVADKVYTSTEYDPSLEVFLHNELSYAGWSPRLVFFGCLQASTIGGQTPLADGRRIYAALPDAILQRFESRGIAYLQHLWDADGEPGIGKSWQETFGTSDRKAAEDYLRQSNMSWEWTDFGIRTRAQHPAVMQHAITGEKCWRNQADQWHRDYSGVKTSFGGGDDPRVDAKTAGVETLGNHVTYGDDSEIDVADLKTIRQINQSQEICFDWQNGDVLVIDNVLAMHGRKPYQGPRRVLVAMA